MAYMTSEGVNPETLKMNVFEAIATRRSIRKYTSQDIPMEILGVILDAGRYAPSAGNLQNWKFIVVKNPDTKGAVAEACMQQLWIAQAPLLIVVVSDMERIKKFYGSRGEMLYSIQNCAAAIENMLLVIHALGLGSTWIGSFDENMINRTLSIPGNARVQGVLPVGYPDEVVPAPKHYAMENITFFDSYGRRYTNIERILQNPLIFDKVSRLIGGVVDRAKDVVDKAKKK